MIVSKQVLSQVSQQVASSSQIGDLITRLGKAIEGFDLPRAHEEAWRYLKPDLFTWDLLTTPAKVGEARLTEFQFEGTGIALRYGKSAFTEADRAVLEKVLFDWQEDSEVSTLNRVLTALSTEVVIVDVPKSTVTTNPVEVVYEVPDTPKFFAPLIVLRLGTQSAGTYVVKLKGGGGAFIAPRIEVVADQAASAEVVAFNDSSLSAQVLVRHRVHAARDARLNFVSVNLGGEVVRQEFDCFLRGQGVSLDMNSLSYTSGRQKFGLFTNQHHLVPYCRSDLYAKAVLADKSRSVYYGYIRVAEKAHQTDAYQTSRNLLLSPDARADTIPNLEIKANDVKCSHGASVGQVSQDELFYLQARGIAKEEAERLLVQGFLEDILSRIKNESIREEISDLVYRRANCGV
jgi:FeS assembly protein SufD